MAMPEFVWTILLVLAILLCVVQYCFPFVARWWFGDEGGGRYPHLSENPTNGIHRAVQVTPITPSVIELAKRRAKLSALIPFVTFLPSSTSSKQSKEDAVAIGGAGNNIPAITMAPTYEEMSDDEDTDEEQGHPFDEGDGDGDDDDKEQQQQQRQQQQHCCKEDDVELTHMDVEACPICLEPFRRQEKVRLIEKCSHIFHSDCILDWLVRNDECPCCRCKVWEESGAVTPSSITLVEDESSGGGIEMVVEPTLQVSGSESSSSSRSSSSDDQV